jgi:hypothetical protein
MHQPAVAHGSEQERDGEIEAENARAQTAICKRYGMSRTKCNVLINATIFSERYFALGPAIEIVEDSARDTPLGNRA